MLAASEPAWAIEPTTYIVVFEGTESDTGFEVGGSNLLNLNTALAAVRAAGGVVTSDLTKQMGIAIASSSNPLFADALRASPLVEEIGRDFYFHAFDDAAAEPLPEVSPLPEPGEDALEFQQWDMDVIHAPEARAAQMGSPAVTVAVLDTGIDVSPTRTSSSARRATSISAAPDRSRSTRRIPIRWTRTRSFLVAPTARGSRG